MNDVKKTKDGEVLFHALEYALKANWAWEKGRRDSFVKFNNKAAHYLGLYVVRTGESPDFQRLANPFI